MNLLAASPKERYRLAEKIYTTLLNSTYDLNFINDFFDEFMECDPKTLMAFLRDRLSISSIDKLYYPALSLFEYILYNNNN